MKMRQTMPMCWRHMGHWLAKVATQWTHATACRHGRKTVSRCRVKHTTHVLASNVSRPRRINT